MSAVHPIEHLIILTEREREYLVRAIESAIHVRKRHQFFLWAQGQFRGVLLGLALMQGVLIASAFNVRRVRRTALVAA